MLVSLSLRAWSAPITTTTAGWTAWRCPSPKPTSLSAPYTWPNRASALRQRLDSGGADGKSRAAEVESALAALQEEALLAWFTQNDGVLVCAPTGTGKTLIAEAALLNGRRQQVIDLQ